MISYIMSFETDAVRVTVHKQDDGSYAVSKHRGEDTVVVATCAEFVDALAVFKGHAAEATDVLLSREIGE